MKDYPRYVTDNFRKFNPLALAEETEKIVSKGKLAKYTGFFIDEEYSGVVTGRLLGCCLRCVFCSAEESRDYPEDYGKFYSPRSAFLTMKSIAIKNGITKLRLSGAEPTICKEHLLAFLGYVEDSKFDFILETNGILLSDEEYVKQISRFKKPTVRISIKAATPEGFARITGAVPASYYLQFQALKNLIKHRVRLIIGLCSDPRIMSRQDRTTIINKLKEIDPDLVSHIDEETLVPAGVSIERLRYAGFRTMPFGSLLPSMTNATIRIFRRIPSESARIVVKRVMYFLFARTRRR